MKRRNSTRWFALLAAIGMAGVGAGAIAGCNTTMVIAAADGGAGTDSAFFGSGLGPDEIPLQIDQTCPGDPGCGSTGDGQLYAGSGKTDITPIIQPFVDTNGNKFHDDGEPFTDMFDVFGDHEYHPVWIAGYGNGRLATGVHDQTWVRCYALKQNQTTIVHCVIDCVGWFNNETDDIKKRMDPTLGIDFLLVSASHLHETQDTVGIWGIDETHDGKDPFYMEKIKKATTAAATAAVMSLRPAKMSVAAIKCQDKSGSALQYISDTRDPVIIEDRMHVLQFDDMAGKSIVTVINFAGHPESTGSENQLITGDFTYWLRSLVEKGSGADVVFVNGALGGQIGPGKVHPVDNSGTVLTRDKPGYGLAFAEAWGTGLAQKALEAIKALKPVDKPGLSFVHTKFNVHVENNFYITASNLHLFDRPFFGYDKSKPLTAEANNSPLITTEVAYLKIGNVSIITVPGELLPENFLGGYDGSASYGYSPYIDMTLPFPADVSKAPKAPYLRDMMSGDEENRIVYGATLDFLGYIVPRYNFVLNDVAPYISQPGGDHYEETNSIGSRAEPELVGTMRQLVMKVENFKL